MRMPLTKRQKASSYFLQLYILFSKLNKKQITS
jgi:hypothetical protein